MGQSADTTHYQQLAANTKAGFNSQFLNPDGASYGDGRETTSVLPLALGMVQDASVTAVAARPPAPA